MEGCILDKNVEAECLEDDRTVYRRNDDGTEEWFRYDDEGRITFYKNNSYEELYAYDSLGKYVRYKDSSGFTSYTTYDTKGNKVYYENSAGSRAWYDYDYDEEKNSKIQKIISKLKGVIK